jgi:hypothetical protein
VPSTDERLLSTRVADLSFVLDRLTDLAAGHNPDAEHRRLPAGLGRALDLTQHHHRAEIPDWADFYDRLLGPRLQGRPST